MKGTQWRADVELEQTGDDCFIDALIWVEKRGHPTLYKQRVTLDAESGSIDTTEVLFSKDEADDFAEVSGSLPVAVAEQFSRAMPDAVRLVERHCAKRGKR